MLIKVVMYTFLALNLPWMTLAMYFSIKEKMIERKYELSKYDIRKT